MSSSCSSVANASPALSKSSAEKTSTPLAFVTLRSRMTGYPQSSKLKYGLSSISSRACNSSSASRSMRSSAIQGVLLRKHHYHRRTLTGSTQQILQQLLSKWVRDGTNVRRSVRRCTDQQVRVANC